MDLDESLSIFWFESQALVAGYAAYALLACMVLSALEFRSQTSSARYPQFMVKALALTVGDVVLATLSIYVTSWHPHLLGGEITTGLGVGAAWYGALYALNASLLRAFAVSLPKSRFRPHLPVVVLMLPCVLLFAFLFALGSAYTI
jgi:hypothetical protein